MRTAVMVVALLMSIAPLALGEPALEKPTCRGEAFNFMVWRFLAKKTASDDPPSVATPVTFRTSDRKRLYGYKVADGKRRPRGAILFVQGNATMAGAIADRLVPLAAGFDVFVFDFRGYGRSEGKSRFAALLNDNIELVAHLRRLGYPKVFIYGTSLGGVLAANMIGESSADAIVIDSAPGTVKPFGCPESFNPAGKLPASCRTILVITGGSDRVIQQKNLEEMRQTALACGARVLHREDWDHPFMGTRDEMAARFAAAISFFGGAP